MKQPSANCSRKSRSLPGSQIGKAPGFNSPWIDDERQFFVGTVPVANGVFRKIAIRKNRVAQLDVRDLSLLRWTDRYYYEVCANPAVYAALQGEKSATAAR